MNWATALGLHTLQDIAKKRGLTLERIEPKQIDGVIYRYELDNGKGMSGLYSTLTDVLNEIDTF